MQKDPLKVVLIFVNDGSDPEQVMCSHPHT